MMFKNLLAGTAALALNAPVLAGEGGAGSYPNLHIVLPIELQWDNMFDSDIPGGEVSDLYFTIEPDITIGANDWLSFNLGLVFEPVEDLDPNEDRVLEDHGLFVETAQAIASFGKLTVNVGKFSAPFSIAYDYAPGVYGDAINEEIEVAERWGAGVAYNFTGEGTDQGAIVRVAAFNRDTSFLSGSIFTNRERLYRSSGGNGNTDSFENFAVAVDLIKLETLPDFHFHAAYMFQAAGDGETSDQNAYVLGANWEKEVSDNATYQILVEWAHSDGALGYGDAASIDGASQDNFTVAASGTWNKRWTAAIGYNFRDEEGVKGASETGAFHLSAGYVIREGWLAEIAYLNIHNDDEGDSQVLGLKLSTELEWSAQ